MFDEVQRVISEATGQDLFTLLERDLTRSAGEIFACVNRLQVEAARRRSWSTAPAGSIPTRCGGRRAGCATWCRPEDAAEEAMENVDRRWVSLSESMHGVWFLNGRLDPEAGALLQTALDAVTSPAQRKQEGCQRARADALVDLARRALAGGEAGTSGGVRPHLMLTSSVETVAGRPSTGGEPGRSRVRRDGAAAGLRRASPRPGGGRYGGFRVVTSVGRVWRTVPPALRRALIARDGGSVWPQSQWTRAPLTVPPGRGGQRRDLGPEPSFGLPPAPRAAPRGRMLAGAGGVGLAGALPRGRSGGLNSPCDRQPVD